jgi:hypothetical protein
MSDKLAALYGVKKNYGYYIFIIKRESGDIIDTYHAGDSNKDSQWYGTGDLSYAELTKFARQTAKEMLLEHGDTKPHVIEHEKWAEDYE